MPRGAVLEPGGAVLACVLLMEQPDLLLEGKKNLCLKFSRHASYPTKGLPMHG